MGEYVAGWGGVDVSVGKEGGREVGRKEGTADTRGRGSRPCGLVGACVIACWKDEGGREGGKRP